MIVDRAVYARGARLDSTTGLHELAVEDAVKAHQRPKLERYGDTLFVVLKTVIHEGPEDMVETGELMLFVGADFLVTVRHGPAGGVGGVREGSSGGRSCSRSGRLRRCTR